VYYTFHLSYPFVLTLINYSVFRIAERVTIFVFYPLLGHSDFTEWPGFRFLKVGYLRYISWIVCTILYFFPCLFPAKYRFSSLLLQKYSLFSLRPTKIHFFWSACNRNVVCPLLTKTQFFLSVSYRYIVCPLHFLQQHGFSCPLPAADEIRVHPNAIYSSLRILVTTAVAVGVGIMTLYCHTV
jgi:hypothetical protein